MANFSRRLPVSRAALAPRRRASSGLLRDLLGGALLLAAWLALWTATWAAIAGPLAPGEPLRRAAAVERANAGS